MFNTEFIGVLDAIRRKTLVDGTIDFKGKGYDFLNRLCDLGGAAYQKLWPKDLKAFISRKETEESERGLRFTFQTSEDLSLYWEMLYSGSPVDPCDPHKFWGFRNPIGRCYFEVDEHDRVSLQSGMLSAVHTKLTESIREVQSVKQYLLGLPKGASVGLRMLDDELKSNAPTVKELIDLFHDESFAFGMVHFACHCDTGDTPLGSSLRLTSRNKEIEVFLEQVLRQGDFGFQNRPFVFLNACQTANVDGLRAGLGFPLAVLNFGAAGVIATACVVPDSFASAFANEFYRRLLAHGADLKAANISAVLMETRVHFMTEYENPMGLAYGLYAGSDQEFRV